MICIKYVQINTQHPPLLPKTYLKYHDFIFCSVVTSKNILISVHIFVE